MANVKYKMISAVLLIVVLAIVLQYFTVRKEANAAQQVLNVELSMEQAIREVEVSIWETANAIFYYMLEPSVISLEEYKKQLKDVSNYISKYRALVETAEERQLIAKFDAAWTDSVSKAEELIKLRDKMKELHEKTWDSVHKVDDVIDYKLQAAFGVELPDLMEKEKTVCEIEESIWESYSATSYYLHRQFDKPQREYSDQLTDVTELWAKYKSLNLTPTEESHLAEFDSNWSHCVKLMNECYSLADELRQKYLAYWESAHAADDVIDFDIQEHLKKRIEGISRP